MKPPTDDQHAPESDPAQPTDTSDDHLYELHAKLLVRLAMREAAKGIFEAPTGANGLPEDSDG